jgi:lipoprotein-releasing system permease protein
VDDSQTGVPQMDNNAVYVPFDILQADLGMDAQPVTLEETGKSATRPARVNEIHVKLKSGASPAETRQKIAAMIQAVFTDAAAAEKRDGLPAWSEMRAVAQTWREHQAEWISPVENEKVLMIFLFAIISLVAVLLIFCIFYMIVAEKIRDIGIIKAVGASNSGVAGIFLGYGLAIGLVGAGVGWGVGYLIVHNINQLHAMAGAMMGIEVFNSDSYIFDTIPNQMNTTETTITLCVAVIASMLGSVVPARRAARMHPVEALRWE